MFTKCYFVKNKLKKLEKNRTPTLQNYLSLFLQNKISLKFALK